MNLSLLFSLLAFFGAATLLAQSTPTNSTPLSSTTSDFAPGDYQKPESGIRLFDVTKISMPEDEQKKLASDLADYVCNTRPLTKQQLELDSAILAFALQLDSKCRRAIITNVKLSENVEPTKVEATITPTVLSIKLHSLAKKYSEGENEEDKKMVGYLLDIAARMDLKNEDAVYEREIYKSSGKQINWSVFYPAPTAPAPTAVTTSVAPGGIVIAGQMTPGSSKNVAKQQASVNGLVVMQMGGQNIGQVSKLIATVVGSYPSGQESRAMFIDSSIPQSQQPISNTGGTTTGPNNPNRNPTNPYPPGYMPQQGGVGMQMSMSLRGASRFIGVKCPNWGNSGNVINVSFSDTSIEKMRDGTSATTAFALLLYSIFDGVALDSKAAVTGDLSADGNVKRIGGVAAKIKGAVNSDCEYVVIPSENTKEIEDYLVLNPIEPLLKIQVYSAANFDEALSVLREDKGENIKKSSELFSKAVEKFKNLPGGVPQRGSRILTPELDEVLKLTPNHVSANLIQTYISGKLPNRLSVGGSVETVMDIAGDYLVQSLRSGENRYLSVPPKDCDTVILRLQDVKFKLDSSVITLDDRLIELMQALRTGKSKTIYTATMQARTEFLKVIGNDRVFYNMLR